MNNSAGQKFIVELIKPSHYDDDGYVVQWWRGSMPSNSLSALYGIMLDARERRVLGDEVDIEINVRDETNLKLPLKRIIGNLERNGNRGIVLLVGVQSNQFPRAMDIMRQLRAAGIQVATGGFHVSGCIAMLPEMPPDLQEAIDLGVTLFVGEAEGRVDELLRAAFKRELRPIYNYLAELPGMNGATLPFLTKHHIKRNLGNLGSFDAGRGCPFSCSFCTIINVQGRKSRYRTADDIEALMRQHAAQGVHSFFITDDNFARNKNWEAILDRLIVLRHQDKIRINIAMQVDTLCHKIPNFIAKAAAAGVRIIFIGLENINPENLRAASKGQNRITEYRKMLQAWRAAKVMTFAGYILGFPSDTSRSIERDIEIIKRELPIDILEFFILTPLPGSHDHKEMYLKGARLDPDMNRYDLEHVTSDHASMSAKEMAEIYDRAWHLYYTAEHVETLLKRSIVGRMRPSRMSKYIFYYYGCYRHEGVHPLQGGAFRRKIRSQRRPGMAIENPLVFYPKRLAQIIKTYGRAGWYGLWLERLRWRCESDPNRMQYTDLAITPVSDETSESLELYELNDSSRAALEQARARHRRASRAAGAASGAP
ncbi:MAG TPA: radical SAM protein [Candidatus Binataceae bacterium]|nr:radical SAM protein [Candidatus Binataceae bacterium]